MTTQSRSPGPIRRLLVCSLLAALALMALPAEAQPSGLGHAAKTCADYSNQREAQLNADTRDADGDGIYCESLPCPCLTTRAPKPRPKPNACTRPVGVVRLVFSSAKYPHIKAHTLRAIRKGWPRILELNRPHAAQRRDRLLANVPTKPGNDRDEYPPAVGRGRANGNKRGLVRGINPIGWMADVAYVPSSENRSHGSLLGRMLHGLCDGTLFRYVFS